MHDAAGDLQIMDVYTNALFKGAIKRARCMELFTYFQSWKLKRLQQMTLAPAVRVFPPFAPPKPTLASGMQTAFQVCTEVFSTERYQSGMRNAFYQRSQFHDQDPIVHCRIWLRYSAKRMGVLKPTESAAVSLGELASDLDVELPVDEDVPSASAEEAGAVSSEDEEQFD